MNTLGIILIILGSIGTGYFFKNKDDDNRRTASVTRRNRNISLGLLLTGIVLVALFRKGPAEPVMTADTSTTSSAEVVVNSSLNTTNSSVVETSSTSEQPLTSTEPLTDAQRHA